MVATRRRSVPPPALRYNGFVCLVYVGWTDQDAMHAVPTGVQFLRGLVAAPAPG